MKFVIYDQFHWLAPDHLEVTCENWDEALAQYRFFRDAHPGESLGLTTLDDFKRIKESITSKACNVCGKQTKQE